MPTITRRKDDAGKSSAPGCLRSESDRDQPAAARRPRGFRSDRLFFAITIMLETIKTLICSIFTGMAIDQVKRGDAHGALWRAHLAMRWAANPYSMVFTHAANARAGILGKNRIKARFHIERAFEVVESTPSIQEFLEIVSIVSELKALQREEHL
jgi:hypothetical protein